MGEDGLRRGGGGSVEEVPDDTPEEAEFLAWIMGEEEVVGVRLPQGIDMARFCIDAGPLDLQVNEEITPNVVSHLCLVLMVEQSSGSIVGGDIEFCQVAHVNTHLQAQGVVKQVEVGIERVFACPQRYGHLILVCAVLKELLHIEMKPAYLKSRGKCRLIEPEVGGAFMNGN